MELSDYVRAVRQWVTVVVALVVVGALAGLAHGVLRTPEYQSTAKVLISVGPEGSTVSDLNLGASYANLVVNNYVDVADTPIVLNGVIDELGLQTTADALAGQVAASAPVDSSIVSITATDTRPQRAADIANATARGLQSAVTTLTPGGSASTATVSVTAVQTARPSASASGLPVWAEVLLGMLGGAALGIALAVVLELADRRLAAPEDLRRVAPAPLLGHLADGEMSDPSSPVLRSRPDSRAAESIRMLRSNLLFLDGPRPTSGVFFVVTSASPGEGRTATALNLALSLADTGSKVLLADGDLRRSELSKALEVDAQRGLGDVLSGTASMGEVITTWPQESLRLLPAGRADQPSELLYSQRMLDLAQTLRRSFDYVVIDVPPLLAVTDGALIGRIGDGVVVVARASYTRIRAVQAGVASLDQIGARVLGFVMIGGRGIERRAYRRARGSEDAAPMRREAGPDRAARRRGSHADSERLPVPGP